MSLSSKNKERIKLPLNIKSVSTELAFVVILGISFLLLQIILSTFIDNATIPSYYIYSWLIITIVTACVLIYSQAAKEKHAQLVLFYFGIGIMTTLNYLQFINNFSDHFIFFYWTMAVSISLGIIDYRLQIQIWAIPLFMVLFATYYADISEAEKLRFYIWNPVITIMSCFGVYSSVKTKKELEKYKDDAQRFEFEYENLLSCMSTMVVIKDDKNRIIRINRKHAEMLNSTVDKFTNVNLYDLLNEEDALKFHKEDLEIINTGKPKLNIIEQLHFPNIDKEVWLRVDKKPYYNQKNEICGVIIFGSDITEEVSAKAEKAKKETEFEQVFTEAPYGILLLNGDKQIIQLNSTFEEMIGFKQAELLNTSIEKIIKLEQGEKGIAIYDGLKEEFSFVRKSGQQFIGKLTISVVNSEDENKSYAIGMVEDITEKREAEVKLMNYSNALKQSNKDLEQFAYAASHDLREPLRMVNSYVTLIAKMYRDKLDERGIEFIDFASNGVKRMDGLINDLLEYSRIGRNDEKNDLVIFDNIIMKVMNNLRVPINEKKVNFDIDVDIEPFIANNTLISMLFQNIINNGIKYNENQPQISIKGHKKGNEIHFSIGDNGIGIDKKFRDKIFQVFQRLHSREQYEGSGIGLAICKRIVQKHGGRLWLESEIGKGSTFYFTIPVDDTIPA